ncbi:hypothetical protein FG386_003238 [Cryptosporidium ryanae]|uniref:uncharacterized protein n=1 Tax=Cryptosporidium ryanae TaxID=515981 RepID=UPI00351A9720|nr:hypothetical protein FG386_003238 [Cryptosporidium ryanae]
MDYAEKLGDISTLPNNLEDQDDTIYTWEKGIVKKWERLVETEKGLVIVDEEGKNDLISSTEQSINDILRESSLPNVRRGLLRNIVVILDMTSNMLELDYKPDRMQSMLKCNEVFIKQLLNDNPLAQISVISVYDGIVEVIISYNSNYDEIIASITNYMRKGCKGNMSIQNSLDKAKFLLTSIPPYGTKEVIFFLGSMRSIDNTFMFDEWIKEFCSNNIAVNAILFIPELYIIKYITKMTGGICLCAINSDHLIRLTLDNLVKPPPSNSRNVSLNTSLVPMGFPKYTSNQNHSFACSCHQRLTNSGYTCPKCKSIVCHLPTKCPVCSIYLTFSNHLARSFAYLFQHPKINKLNTKNQDNHIEKESISNNKCKMCDNTFENKIELSFVDDTQTTGNIYLCLKCNSHICSECCRFILTTLHQCPVCCTQRKE